MIALNGRHIAIDDQGYLLNWQDWTPELVPLLAKQDALALTPTHWEVILFVREFYLDFKTSPGMRMLTKALQKKWSPEKTTSRYLQQLFPKGPAKQATRLAGLPKPVKCL